MECMAGRSAHPSNWYCPQCDQEESNKPREQLSDYLEWFANTGLDDMILIPRAKLEDIKFQCDRLRGYAHHCDYRVRIEAISQQLKTILDENRKLT